MNDATNTPQEINRLEKIADGELIRFHNTLREKKVIKIVGVGGGGGNAVADIYRAGVDNVSYLIANTDAQDLEENPIPTKLILGTQICKGLGTGDDPEVGRMAAESSSEEIRKHLDDGQTEIVFLAAGMGKGTGTGASPVIAHIAKAELGLLTLAIVTIPFKHEGRQKIIKAIRGLERLRKEVDVTLVINNQRILDLHPKHKYDKALALANDILVDAARSITDLIYHHGYFNVDTNDIRTTLRNGGVAVISSGYGSGEKRLKDAIDEAINSPMLKGNDVYRASRLLVFVYMSHEHGLLAEEISYIQNLSESIDRNFNYVYGWGYDDDLGEQVKVTILASGFDFSVSNQYDLAPEDELSKQERAAKEMQEEEMLAEFYDTTEVGQIGGNLGIASPFILSDYELDNDEIISILDSEAALTRNHYILEQIRSRNKRTRPQGGLYESITHLSTPTKKEMPQAEPPAAGQTILF